MQIDITLKNYRCFPDTSPVKISLRNEFISLVGPNNAGKSSLLKVFYEFRALFQSWIPNSHTVSQILQGQSQSYNLAPTLFDWTELFSNTNNRDLTVEIALPDARNSYRGGVAVAHKIVFELARQTNSWSATLFVADNAVPRQSFSLAGNGDLLTAASRPVAYLTELFAASKDLSNALYIGPFRNAVNVGSNDAYFDIQVGQGFITAWKQYKTGNLKKHNEACHKLTEDIKRIFAYSDLDISSSADDRSLQLLIDGKSFKLPEVGAGLAQFILVLGTAAIKNPSYILIDEPELSLHPSLQLDFLTTLASYATRGIVFATHSLGLARAAADHCYSVRKINSGISEVRDLESTSHLAEFSGELSFSSYKEMGFDSILLVEGRTEVKTLQQFLRLLRKDHQVVLIPMGGGEMINTSSEGELVELTRISNKISTIIDSEKSHAGDPLSESRQGFARACAKAKITCKVLDRRAIENYFPERAVKRAKGDAYRALDSFESRKQGSPMWPKTENWRIAREMTKEELLETDLGQFLNGL
ncbi:MAG TPA: AAA family ATPase [Candidatus Acidoferrum sp.]|jgi:ABC-type cobalamin/Fe3+-siderophores transport system ATPase subunit